MRYVECKFPSVNVLQECNSPVHGSRFYGNSEYRDVCSTSLNEGQQSLMNAAGIANIKKIKQTDTSGASSASAVPTTMASVAPPAVVPEVETVHNLTTSSDMAHQESMMKDQKVYILSSDLEANGKHVEIRERETTF